MTDTFLHRLPLASFAGGAYVLIFGVPTIRDISLFVLAILSILTAFLQIRNEVVLKDSIFLTLVIFLGAHLLACAFSVDAEMSLWLSVSLVPSLLLAFMIEYYFKTIDDTQMFSAALSCLAMGLSIGLILTMAMSDGQTTLEWVAEFPSPIIVVPNDLILVAVVMPLSLALGLRSPCRAVRTLATLSLLSSLAAIVAFQSRGALLTSIVGLGAFAVLVSPRRLGPILMGLLVFALVVDLALGFPMLAKFGLAEGRIPLWRAAWSMFIDSPVLGFGPHTYGMEYGRYLSVDELTRFMPWPHNLFLEVLAEHGLVGLVALLLILVRPLWMGWGLRQSTDLDAALYGIAATCGLLSICCAALYELTFLRLWVPVILFSIVALIGNASYLCRTSDKTR